MATRKTKKKTAATPRRTPTEAPSDQASWSTWAPVAEPFTTFKEASSTAPTRLAKAHARALLKELSKKKPAAKRGRIPRGSVLDLQREIADLKRQRALAGQALARADRRLEATEQEAKEERRLRVHQWDAWVDAAKDAGQHVELLNKDLAEAREYAWKNGAECERLETFVDAQATRFENANKRHRAQLEAYVKDHDKREAARRTEREAWQAAVGKLVGYLDLCRATMATLPPSEEKTTLEAILAVTSRVTLPQGDPTQSVTLAMLVGMAGIGAFSAHIASTAYALRNKGAL